MRPDHGLGLDPGVEGGDALQDAVGLRVRPSAPAASSARAAARAAPHGAERGWLPLGLFRESNMNTQSSNVQVQKENKQWEVWMTLKAYISNLLATKN